MQQALDFIDESDALYAIVFPLSDEQLGQKTAFKGWTIGNVIGHLHMWNWAADLSLCGGEASVEFFREVGDYVARGNLPAFERQWLSGLEGRALVATWRKFYRDVGARFVRADPSRRVKWAGPDMSVRSSITARLMETWAHGQEIYDLLGVERKSTNRIRNIVTLGVKTYGWTFKNRGEDIPGPMPYLKLVAPSGEFWTFGEQSESEVIEGRAEEFCHVVTQTRNVADTQLRVVGTVAVSWMDGQGPMFRRPPGGAAHTWYAQARHEQHALDPADLLESKIELVLPLVSGQFLQHRRRRDDTGLQGRNEPQDLIPALGNDVGLDTLAHERFKTCVSGGRFEAGETAVGKVAKARAKTEAEHCAEREDMVGRAPCVGVMFDNLKR